MDDRGGGGGEAERWPWWAAASAAQAASGVAWFRRGKGGAAVAMPFKAFAIASLFVGAGATAVGAGVLAAGVGSVEEMKGMGASIRRWMGAPPRRAGEEERVVLELQAQFGNKWARISTYLPGRTDNDVKNFWSTRQKRLARLLGTPLRRRSSRSRGAKAPVVASSSLESRPAVTVVPCLDQAPLEGSSSGVHPCRAGAATPFMDAHSASAALAPYDWAGSGLVSFDGAPLPLASDSHACSSSNAAALPPLLPFDQPLYPVLDFPGLPAGWNMAPGFANAGTMEHLAYQELLPVTQPAPMMLPFFSTEYPHGGVKAELPDAAPDNFFDDLPPDMFDSLDQPPPPLSPPATSSGF